MMDRLIDLAAGGIRDLNVAQRASLAELGIELLAPTMLDHGGRPASRTARVLASIIALAGAAYLTYLAVSYLHSGCSCASSGDTTAAGIARATLLIAGATALYVFSAALAYMIVRNRPR